MKRMPASLLDVMFGGNTACMKAAQQHSVQQVLVRVDDKALLTCYLQTSLAR